MNIFIFYIGSLYSPSVCWGILVPVSLPLPPPAPRHPPPQEPEAEDQVQEGRQDRHQPPPTLRADQPQEPLLQNVLPQQVTKY